jgi:hypothetical protein
MITTILGGHVIYFIPNQISDLNYNQNRNYSQTICNPVDHFVLTCNTQGRWPLGERKFLPAMRVEFMDERGKVTQFEYKVRLLGSAAGMTIKCEDHDEPQIEMWNSDLGVLDFDEEQWLAVPSERDGSFLSPDSVVEKTIDISFSIFKEVSPKNWDMIGQPQTITITFTPGLPASVVQVSTI